MVFSRPLRSELFRLGKRSQLSLDGTVKGIVYNKAGGMPVTAPLPTGGPTPLYERPTPADYIPHGGPAPPVMPAPIVHDPPHVPRTPQLTGRLIAPPPLSMAADAIPGADAYSVMLATNAAVDEIQQDWQADHDAAFGVVSDAEPDPALHAIHEMFHTPTQAADEISYGGATVSHDMFNDAMADAATLESPTPAGAAPDPQVDAIDPMSHTPTHAPEPLDYQEAAVTPELFAQETGVAPVAATPIMPDGPAADSSAPPDPMQPADYGPDPLGASAAPGPDPLEQIVQHEFDNMPDGAAPHPGPQMAPGTDPTQMPQDMWDLMMQQQMAPYMAPGVPAPPGMPMPPGMMPGPGPG